jgi:hypothetical protein
MRKNVGYGIAIAALVFAAAAPFASVARGDDRGTTAALLDELERDAPHKPATGELVRKARTAMERATRLRATGDETHAALADGLARQQAEAARDLVRAIDAERAAEEARRAATDAGALGERERALLEEGIARNGRLRAELDALGAARSTPDTKAGAKAGHEAAKPPRVAKIDGGAP